MTKRSSPNPLITDQRAAIYSFNGDGSGGDGGANWWGEITLRDIAGNETVRFSGYDNSTGVGPVLLMSYSSSTVKLSTRDGIFSQAKIQTNTAFNVAGSDVINSGGSFIGSSVNTPGSVSSGGTVSGNSFVYKPTGQAGLTQQINVGHPTTPASFYIALYVQGGLIVGVQSVAK